LLLITHTETTTKITKMSRIRDRRHANSHIMAFKLSETLRGRIKATAKRRDISEGELIRRALDRYLEDARQSI